MARAARSTTDDISDLIGRWARPLGGPEADDFARAFDPWADRRVVLLGEASHGSAEFYDARAAITRHLIEHHGFTIVAVEADWPDAAVMNRFVRGMERPEGIAPFQRFPRWMWRNPSIGRLLDWMRNWNRGRPAGQQAGFYGLDMYNMQASMRAVVSYLDRVDAGAARIARDRYGCLQPWADRPGAYGRAVLSQGYQACEDAVVRQCREMIAQQLSDGQGADTLDAVQNARLVASAERYYRVMYRGGAEAWNLRDSHMCDTLADLLDAAGPDSRAVVWAHNSHIGDARHTQMGQSMEQHSLGQLARQRWGKAVALVGFGTHAGTVTAASDWDSPAEVKAVMPSQAGSFERQCHNSGLPRFLLDMAADPALTEELSRQRLQRFIGVIYRPRSELLSHYLQTAPSRQYDAWVWFDGTTALVPAERAEPPTDLPDTWPFGL